MDILITEQCRYIARVLHKQEYVARHLLNTAFYTHVVMQEVARLLLDPDVQPFLGITFKCAKRDRVMPPQLKLTHLVPHAVSAHFARQDEHLFWSPKNALELYALGVAVTLTILADEYGLELSEAQPVVL